MTDLVEATRRECIQTAIDNPGFIDGDCDGEPITAEQGCRLAAITAIPPAELMLGNESFYELEITTGGGCDADNYCGTSAGTFKEATRKIEILR